MKSTVPGMNFEAVLGLGIRGESSLFGWGRGCTCESYGLIRESQLHIEYLLMDILTIDDMCFAGGIRDEID